MHTYKVRIGGGRTSSGKFASEFREVEGKPVWFSHLPNFEFFIHKNVDCSEFKWLVSEAQTGCAVTRGMLRKQVLNKATELLATMTPEDVQQAIDVWSHFDEE